MNIITEDHSKECSEEDVLFVGRLGGYIKERDLMQHFNRYGKIRSVHLVRDGYGFSKGYGFVTFWISYISTDYIYLVFNWGNFFNISVYVPHNA